LFSLRAMPEIGEYWKKEYDVVEPDLRCGTF